MRFNLFSHLDRGKMLVFTNTHWTFLSFINNLLMLKLFSSRCGQILTFHNSPTASANSSSPAMTLPTITPTGTSPFSPGLLMVTSTWSSSRTGTSLHALSVRGVSSQSEIFSLILHVRHQIQTLKCDLTGCCLTLIMSRSGLEVSTSTLEISSTVW